MWLDTLMLFKGSVTGKIPGENTASVTPKVTESVITSKITPLLVFVTVFSRGKNSAAHLSRCLLLLVGSQTAGCDPCSLQRWEP